ncbi:flavin monoamine oxidase family protein [Mucilaginibacter ginsenosidivorans]|uniref:FAD-dependent oxidoreductase n=1 Tax=Mucilaginibacter ginsenosidivorans TaxID=398053 RepID=A0A5B8UZH1_9SPHI|nr:FAD-dependent oxidoreductase [Mucilaginibacter ginsenosidivorans]QEC63771.1 FAD-dependent oxidoreductase [Mucilaginibacter ginsenosidivorans]
MPKIKRREFIRSTIVAGAGAALAPQLAFAATNIPVPKKIIVAGAGITGLCCAYELMKAGHDVTVLEASGRYGGHVFTGRDGLSDGLYADFGADHITKPGYEKFFEYVDEFRIEAIPYPNAEGSEHAYDKNALKMIGGKFYTAEQLKDPAVLTKMGFNEKEIQFLSKNSFSGLNDLYVKHYTDKFTDPYQPFGVGYDELDKIPIADIYKKEGASAAALGVMGGKGTSALYYLWRLSLMYSRGIPLSEGETFHLKDGNEQLPIAFAKRLGDKLKLNNPITAIQHNAQGVTVTYKSYGSDREKQMSADFLVNCITLPVFRNIPVTPPLSAAKQYVVDNLAYSSHPFFVFEAATKFWLDDGYQSINMEFEHPDIYSIWQETNHVDTSRIILKAFGPSGVSPQRVLAAFREVYPGKKDTIEQALTLDWSKDRYAPVCEMEPFPIGEMHKFWPQIMLPEGRIYFAGTYADNMSRGMESCIRSAQRVAQEIAKI